MTTTRKAGEEIVTFSRPYFGLLVGLGERHDLEEQSLAWKTTMVKSSLEELKKHEKEDRTVEKTEHILREVWLNDILPELVYEILPANGELQDGDVDLASVIPGHWDDPALCYTTEVINDAEEDWASPTLCLSILDAYEKPEEPEPEAEKPEEPEPEAEKPEEPEPEAEKPEEPEPEAEKPEEPSTTIANPADRSESRLLNWEWFSEIAEMDNPGNLPKVVEHLNGKGLIRTKQDMLDTILLVLVSTKKIDLKDAGVIFDRFDTLL